MPTKKELIEHQHLAASVALKCISILEKVEVGGIYLIEGYKGRDEVVIVEDLGYGPEIRGTLLAAKHRDPLDDPLSYSRWIKFIDEVKPFTIDMAPLCVNWEYISPEFKNLYFK